MLDSESLDLIRHNIDKDLCHHFPNKIWNTSIYPQYIYYDEVKDIYLVKRYIFIITTTTKKDTKLIDAISDYLTIKYDLNLPIIDVDEYKYYVLNFTKITEEHLLSIEALLKLS